MKRFIRYLYEYEQGRRLRNVGFVKAEQGEDDCTLHIHGKGLHMKGERKLDVYLFYEDGDECVGIWQGTVDHVNPAINYRLYYTKEDVMAPDNFDRINGIILESELGHRYAAIWNEDSVDVGRMRILRPEMLQREEIVSDAAKKEEAQEDSAEEKEAEIRQREERAEQIEDRDGREGRTDVRDDGERRTDVRDAGEEKAEVGEEREGDGVDKAEDGRREHQHKDETDMSDHTGGIQLEEVEEAPWDVKENMRRPGGKTEGDSESVHQSEEKAPEILEDDIAVQDIPIISEEDIEEAVAEEEPLKHVCADQEHQEVERQYHCSKIQRNELARLPRCEWKWANNSFLLHGYYNYHHLAFIDDGDRFRLGIPGIYHPQEAKAASMFGFTEFVPIQDIQMDLTDDEKSSEDQFGYWCRQVKRPLKM